MESSISHASAGEPDLSSGVPAFMSQPQLCVAASHGRLSCLQKVWTRGYTERDKGPAQLYSGPGVELKGRSSLTERKKVFDGCKIENGNGKRRAARKRKREARNGGEATKSVTDSAFGGLDLSQQYARADAQCSAVKPEGLLPRSRVKGRIELPWPTASPTRG